jgi:hypothetical protein
MEQTVVLAFARRDNPNGTTDSVCRACCTIVANAFWEADLESAERDHKCDQLRLERIRTEMEKVKSAK